MRTGIRIALPIFALALAACSDSTAPRIDRVYTLEKYGGRPLPVVYDSGPTHMSTIYGGMLTLRADGIYYQVDSVRIEREGVLPSEGFNIAEGRYTIDGQTVDVLGQDCHGLCEPFMTGRIDESTLTIKFANEGSLSPEYDFRLISSSPP